ncbi:MAG: YbjP/YqhG family protein [Chloroflexota bacterium]|nr:YbjP/YqhG family protein [Chloroflexota bacterium]
MTLTYEITTDYIYHRAYTGEFVFKAHIPATALDLPYQAGTTTVSAVGEEQWLEPEPFDCQRLWTMSWVDTVAYGPVREGTGGAKLVRIERTDPPNRTSTYGCEYGTPSTDIYEGATWTYGTIIETQGMPEFVLGGSEPQVFPYDSVALCQLFESLSGCQATGSWQIEVKSVNGPGQ